MPGRDADAEIYAPRCAVFQNPSLCNAVRRRRRFGHAAPRCTTYGPRKRATSSGARASCVSLDFVAFAHYARCPFCVWHLVSGFACCNFVSHSNGNCCVLCFFYNKLFFSRNSGIFWRGLVPTS